jgi:hypothetical protein
MIERQTEFIITDNDNIYLPPPTSWLGGWMRHMWFESTYGTKPKIASADYWCQLSKKNTVKIWTQYKNGCLKIVSKRKNDE